MSQRLRVVHTAAFGGPYRGGFIPMLEAAREAVGGQGWTFEVVFSAGAERYAWYRELQRAGVVMHVAPSRPARQAAAWLRQLLAGAPGPALLHTHFSDWDTPAVLARLGPTRPGLVWHMHSSLSPRPTVRARNTLRFGLMARLVDQILCVSPDIQRELRARLGPVRRSRVFPNGVDLNHFTPVEPAERAAMRAQLGIEDGDSTLVLFGHDWERKGGRLLLESLPRLQHAGRRAVAVIVGAPARAREDARALGVQANVRMLDPVEDSRVLYGAADVFTAPSTREGMPLAVLEALCCGRPVVASDIPSHRYVAEKMPGCRLATRTVGALTQAITAELDCDPAARERRLAASRHHVERELSLEAWARRLVAVYEEVLSARRWPEAR